MKPLKLERLFEEKSDTEWGAPETPDERRSRRLTALSNARRSRLEGGGNIRAQARKIRDEGDDEVSRTGAAKRRYYKRKGINITKPFG